MKVHIPFHIKTGPWGGSNSFTRTLQQHLSVEGHYTQTPGEADIFLFVSYNDLKEVIRLKRKFPDKKFIQRLDGPMELYNHTHDKRDTWAYWGHKHIADGVVFQSQWSREQNYKIGLQKMGYETVIMNAADPTIFNSHGRKAFAEGEKMRVVITSWSANPKKGFRDYQWLDENLDYSQYDITFIGNSPIVFQNIHHLSPLASQALAVELKRHDIYLTASEKDPCSNALIEGLSCGLPAVAKNDGGHPEIVKNGGELFENIEQVPNIFEKIRRNYTTYQSQINVPPIAEIGNAYLAFFEACLSANTPAKKLSLHAALLMGLRFQYF